MSMYRVLLVEDDRNIQALISNYFTKKRKGSFFDRDSRKR